jgi:hypothetical protein
MDKTDYVLKNKPEPAANETVWGSARVPRAGSGVAPGLLVELFGLGAGFSARRRKRQPGRSRSPQTAVNTIPQFLHKASLLIPAEFAETKTAAGRRRMWRTRQPVSKEALIGAIKKCHQTLWAGGKLSPPAAFGELCKIIFLKTSDQLRDAVNQLQSLHHFCRSQSL